MEASRDSVAVTSRPDEATAIDYLHSTSRIFNQAAPLKLSRYDGYGCPARTQHHGKKLLGKFENMRLGSVLRHK